jgi:UDP-glucuronate decarboxylase
VHELLEDALNLIDYRLFYIVTASFLFGRSQSILSIGLASFWYLVSNVLNGQEIISQLIDHNTLVHIGLYIFIGLTMGYVIDKKEKVIKSSLAEVDSIQGKFNSLNAIYKDTVTVKDELQDQVLYTDNSIATVYSIMKELDSLDLQEIYSAAIKITDEIMKTNGAALYILDDSQKNLKLEENSADLIIPDFIKISDNKTVQEVLNTNRVQVNKGLDPKQPTMIAPLSIGGTIIGIIGIYHPQFEYLTLSYQNLFAVTVNLISSAINRAYKHEQLLVSNNINKGKHFNNKEEAYV